MINGFIGPTEWMYRNMAVFHQRFGRRLTVVRRGDVLNDLAKLIELVWQNGRSCDRLLPFVFCSRLGVFARNIHRNHCDQKGRIPDGGDCSWMIFNRLMN